MGLLSAPWSLLPSGTFLTMMALFFSVFALILDFMKRRRSWSRYPPGPTSLPFFGNILQADFNSLPEYCARLRKTYGDVFSLQFCWENVVFFNGLESVKEGLITKSDDTSDRPINILTKKFGFNDDSTGVVFARYGQTWKDIRRFSLSTLRDFGLGKKSLAERVSEEAGVLCSAFKSKGGSPFDPHLLINNAVSNVICSIVFGDRFEYHDKNFLRVLTVFENLLKTSSGLLAQLINVIPALVHVPGVASDLFKSQDDILDFLRGIITEHKKTYDPNMKRDFIDAFLEEVEKHHGREGFFMKAATKATFLAEGGTWKGCSSGPCFLRWKWQCWLFCPTPPSSTLAAESRPGSGYGLQEHQQRWVRVHCAVYHSSGIRRTHNQLAHQRSDILDLLNLQGIDVAGIATLTTSTWASGDGSANQVADEAAVRGGPAAVAGDATPVNPTQPNRQEVAARTREKKWRPSG